jgi:hypothetical protein
LPASTVARNGAPAEPVSHDSGAGSAALSVCRRGICRHAQALSSADQRTAGALSFDRHAGFEAGLCPAGSAPDTPSPQPDQPELFERGPQHIWQKRFYDFNIWTGRKRIEKLRYIHRNPVKRGLVASPELWRWSSYRAYSFGEAGPVVVNGWQVLKMKIRPPAA